MTVQKMTTILFDLDGTLLSMDNDEFLKIYLADVSTVIEGVDPKELANIIVQSTYEVIAGPRPEHTNEMLFIEKFQKRLKMNWEQVEEKFNSYYKKRFPKLQKHFPPRQGVPEMIEELKRKGYTLVLATNPVFPAEAVRTRIKWAGLSPDDFMFFTSYEDSFYCKPNPAYFTEVLRRAEVSAGECVMVGNDAAEDIAPANKVGIKTFFLTNHAIGETDNATYRGDYDDLMEWANSLPEL